MDSEYPVRTAFLIDDSEVDLFIQRKFIEMRHFANEIVSFSSSNHALRAMNDPAFSHPPDIVFLDLNMPVVDGFEFLEQARMTSGKLFDSMKVVILTSSTNEDDREKARSYKNVISFISKPLTAQGLDELKRILEKPAA